MPIRVISFALLLAVCFSVGGIGQLLHERQHDADHENHDHATCTICQTLAAPRVDRLPGGLFRVALVDPPIHTPPTDEAAPQRIVVHRTIEARGPPAAPRA